MGNVIAVIMKKAVMLTKNYIKWHHRYHQNSVNDIKCNNSVNKIVIIIRKW